MSKISFLDVETTGLSPKFSFVHQIAGEIWVNDIKVDCFDLKVRPPSWAQINKRALEVSGTTEEQLRKYPSVNEAYAEFTEIFNKHCDSGKFRFAAYNAPFDWKFVRGFVAEAEKHTTRFDSMNKYFYYEPLDVLKLVRQYFRDRGLVLDSYSLGNIADFFGVKTDGAHQANHDVRIMVEIYKIIKDEI